jgi:hypothetical protein
VGNGGQGRILVKVVADQDFVLVVLQRAPQSLQTEADIICFVVDGQHDANALLTHSLIVRIRKGERASTEGTGEIHGVVLHEDQPLCPVGNTSGIRGRPRACGKTLHAAHPHDYTTQ